MSEQTPMTPTAQIAAIRQRAEKRYQLCGVTAAGRDLNTILDIWDTHQSALRALVAEVQDRIEYMHRDTDWYRAQELEYWKRKLERLLESEQ